MRTKLGMLVAGFGLLCLAVPVVAHHSTGEYDQEQVVEGTGVVTRVEWTNPHMRVYVDVTDDEGVVTTWNMELGSPNSVRRRGWTRDDLKAGERISFRGFAGRAVRTRIVADAITLADGREFRGASGAPDR